MKAHIGWYGELSPKSKFSKDDFTVIQQKAVQMKIILETNPYISYKKIT